MLNKLREKAHVFWLRHRSAIIGFGVFAVGTVGIGMAVNNYVEKKDAERAEAEAKANTEAEERRRKAREEYEAEEERIKNDPANQITSGGYIRPYNDDLCDSEIPNAIINDVPLSSMGEFGKNILERLNASYFPDDVPKEDRFQLDTAVSDVCVYFGHEVWKMNNPEESQEKQVS